jgi:serine/threonine-protein kinase RsbW
MTVWTRRFRGGPACVPAARRLVREKLRGELDERRLEDVELIVSELATNSIRHAGAEDGGELSMTAEVSGGRVRLQVCDHGEGFPEHTPAPPPKERAGGFGLVLLDRLSDRWGTRRDGTFCVWFEVDRSHPA